MHHIILGASAIDTTGLGFSNMPSFLWTIVQYYGMFIATLMAVINAAVKGTQDNFEYQKYFSYGYETWYDIIVQGILM